MNAVFDALAIGCVVVTGLLSAAVVVLVLWQEASPGRREAAVRCRAHRGRGSR